jgi:uncharacterized protein (DUF1697 family)
VKYISILRGINVTGQKKIKMADLKALYEAQEFESVTTYIQSGNVIFESKMMSKEGLKKTIENAIEDKFTFHVPVDIRTNQELKQIVENCPYEEVTAEENSTKILVAFLQSTPSTKKQELLLEYVKSPERLTIQGSEVYLYCPNGYGRSKLTNTFIENKLGISATTRNWKSVKKLYELSVH